MSNLNVDFSKGLFSDSNAVLTSLERGQLANLRDVTQNFTDVVRFKEILTMTPTRLANIPDNMIGDVNAFLSQNVTAGGSADALACSAAESLTSSIGNNVDADYTVFTTKDAMDTYLVIIKDMCNALAVDLRPTFITDPSVMTNMSIAMLDSMTKNVSAHNPFNTETSMFTLQEYVLSCADNTKLYLSNNLAYDETKKRQLAATFMVAFYPLLIARYIASYIRTAGETEASPKPTSFIVRQFAVLSLKVFMVQVMLMLLMTCPTTSLRNSLKAAIKTLLRSIADEYDTQAEFDTYYQQIMLLASQNKDTREAIETMSKDVMAAKNNQEKAVLNDQRAISDIKRTKMLMNIWLALLVIFIVAATVLVVLGKAENGMFMYLYVVCAIFVVPVFINAMVQIIRKT